jgi:predicted dehydrogenase
MSRQSRRSFLKSAVAGAAALSLAGKVRARSAGEQLRYGVIGCGGRGLVYLEGASYVCDPDRKRLSAAARSAGVDSKHAVTDLRRILDDPDIDAVVIATPDHWHAPAALLACAAGKHVYLEKPASHNFRESQLLVKAARENNLIVQHGTQQRSRPFTIDAVAALHDGLIGDVLVAKAWNVQRRENIGHLKPTAPPAGVDYDLWVGPAEMVPYQSNRFHYNWHWWHDFGTGDIGNDGAHDIDYARWGLGVDTLPSKITAVGGKYYFDDDQEFPDTATCVFEYPGDREAGSRKQGAGSKTRQLIFEMRLWSGNYPMNCDSGVEFYGTKGTMFFSKRGKLTVIGKDNEPLDYDGADADAPYDHFAEFVAAIRDGRRPNADMLQAHRSIGLVHLANIAIRVGRSLTFDPQSEQIANDQQASELLSRSYRSDGHWAIPAGV